MIYVLIEANDGSTGIVIVASGIDDMVRQVQAEYVQRYPNEDVPYLETERDALLAMIDTAPWSEIGRHELQPIAPHWEEWTFIVADVSSGRA